MYFHLCIPQPQQEFPDFVQPEVTLEGRVFELDAPRMGAPDDFHPRPLSHSPLPTPLVMETMMNAMGHLMGTSTYGHNEVHRTDPTNMHVWVAGGMLSQVASASARREWALGSTDSSFNMETPVVVVEESCDGCEFHEDQAAENADMGSADLPSVLDLPAADTVAFSDEAEEASNESTSPSSELASDKSAEASTPSASQALTHSNLETAAEQAVTSPAADPMV